MINYAYSKNVSLTFGYLYSQFRLNDSSLNSYQYTPSSSVYLTGAIRTRITTRTYIM